MEHNKAAEPQPDLEFVSSENNCEQSERISIGLLNLHADYVISDDKNCHKIHHIHNSRRHYTYSNIIKW